MCLPRALPALCSCSLPLSMQTGIAARWACHPKRLVREDGRRGVERSCSRLLFPACTVLRLHPVRVDFAPSLLLRRARSLPLEALALAITLTEVASNTLVWSSCGVLAQSMTAHTDAVQACAVLTAGLSLLPGLRLAAHRWHSGIPHAACSYPGTSRSACCSMAWMTPCASLFSHPSCSQAW